MRKVALITYSDQSRLNNSDKLLVKPFYKHGFIIDAIPWDKKDVIWNSYEIVILRSSWDYHYRIPEFITWLEYLNEKRVNLWNPIKIIKWNMNKKYLLDLEKKGVLIIPTLILNKDTIKSVKNSINNKKWKEIIIKPVYGASAYKISKITRDPSTRSFYSLVRDDMMNDDLLVQPFIREITTIGEFSFIFFNKKFSHAIHKKPKRNEFRSQPEFGGSEALYQPTIQQISQAQKILHLVDSPLIYARVDGLIIKNKFILMELELIEPYLYFEKKGGSAEKFVESVIELSNKYQPN